LLEAAFRRDRTVVGAALAAMTALAWTYLLWLSANMDMSAPADNPGMAMPGMNMPKMSMPGMIVPEFRPWSVGEFAFTFGMWAVMMVGMMTPSAAPMVLAYAAVGRKASAQGKPFAATGWFVTGYLLTWIAFAFAATAGQFALTQAALLDETMASASRVFGGAVLIAAGAYQWTPSKEACLTQCQSPLVFIQRYGGFRRDPQGSVLLGLRHGAYCVGCCWILMGLLFVGGVMNVLWIAAISAFVLVEKTLPAGRLFSRTAGLILIAAGVWLVAT
jgi:predicted metal-binding membrane protein